VDTGAGLERIAAVMQGVTNNFHIDLFRPVLDRIGELVRHDYGTLRERAPGEAEGGPDPASYRVIADHARAVAFLLADGVFPSNEGRGYVLRRILRRAVRHAWLLGRREPTLVRVTETVIETMSDVYPELRQRQAHIVETTRAEEERFLSTIEGGMRRFDEVAPEHTTQGSSTIRGTISGEDAFRLYDTFGFPIDLTELMARERDYTVDIAGFEAALAAQRTQSQEDRRSRKLGVDVASAQAWEWHVGQDAVATGQTPETAFVGYETVEIETQVAAVRTLDDGRVAILLRETPFYAEAGGQVSDGGEIVGAGWRVDVEDVRKVDGRTAAIGRLTGTVEFGQCVARVPTDRRRDTERNHTATHLLHAALRQVLGDHVHQAGSLVAPDRLRFDFTHHGPVRPDALGAIEEQVNRAIWAGIDVRTEQRPYREAVAAGAMALFGEKYGDVVRVVTIPGVSVELCGGTHVRNTAQIAVFRIVSETGVAAGVRRIEALTGRGAFDLMRDHERTLLRVGELLKAAPDAVVRRVQGLLDERRTLERRLDEALKGGGDQVRRLIDGARAVNGLRLVSAEVEVEDVKALQAMGDALRDQIGSGVGALGGRMPGGKAALVVVATDDARARGVGADAVVRELAAAAGGRGGGKPHMAQAGIPDPARLEAGLAQLEPVVRSLLGG
jgi:alanyl-tRNA synthetase